jgi:MtN3 and saliva related transmembrane protein
MLTESIGYLAATIGTFLMLPQVVKTIRTKKADDLSAWMLAAYLIQCALWFVYALRIEARPLLLCNAVAFCIGSALAVLKYRYRPRRPRILLLPDEEPGDA